MKKIMELENNNFLRWQQNLLKKKLPAVIVDFDAFKRNMQKIAASVTDTAKTIRIATKSFRVPALIQYVLQYGLPFQGVMCYSVAEANYLHHLDIDDFLIAYPTFQENDLILLRRMQQSGTKVALVIDSYDQIIKIAELLQLIDKKIPIPHTCEVLRLVLELDMSYQVLGKKLGTLRSSISSNEDVKKILRLSRQFSSIKIVGVMAYEAIVAGLPDRNPFSLLRNPIKSWIRKKAIQNIALKRLSIAEIFESEGMHLEIFNGGGTGSIDFAVQEAALNEVTVGSGFLCGHLFDYYSNLNASTSFRFEPALFFALQTTRYPNKNTITCHGGGYVASGEAGLDRLPLPVYPPGLKLVRMEGCGEVQTPLKINRDLCPPRLGEAVFFRHAKSGELAEHFNEYYLSENGDLVKEVKTYRGLGFCF